MKNKIKITTLALLFVISACGSKELKIKVNDHVETEYGSALVDSDLYDVADSDKDVRVKEIKNFDTKRIGDQKVIVVFINDNNKTKEEEITISVKDTKIPEIKLKKDIVEIEEGDDYTLENNIESVKDPVDGDLTYSKEKVEKDGYYIDSNDFDQSKAGSYEVTIKAIDVNGNESDAVFKVVVKEKELTINNTSGSTNNGSSSSVSNDTSGYSNSGSSTSASNNTSGSSSGGSSSSNTQPAPEQPQTCEIHPNEYGNTGTHFATMEEAEAWADPQVLDPASKYFDFRYILEEMGDSCGNSVGWSVSFWPMGSNLLP